jgi:hypothetical protein
MLIEASSAETFLIVNQSCPGFRSRTIGFCFAMKAERSLSSARKLFSRRVSVMPESFLSPPRRF